VSERTDWLLIPPSDAFPIVLLGKTREEAEREGAKELMRGWTLRRKREPLEEAVMRRMEEFKRGGVL
jgi:hypothetical protein